MQHLFKILLISLALPFWRLEGYAQENITFSPRIKTLQVKVDG